MHIGKFGGFTSRSTLCYGDAHIVNHQKLEVLKPMTTTNVASIFDVRDILSTVIFNLYKGQPEFIAYQSEETLTNDRCQFYQMCLILHLI